jgi:hypothetical protein
MALCLVADQVLIVRIIASALRYVSTRPHENSKTLITLILSLLALIAYS